MNIKSVENVSFGGVKNTFLNKAKNAHGIINKKYSQSLHHEAKARLEYVKYQNASQELDNMDFDWSLKSIAKATKTVLEMVNHKLSSVKHQTAAYDKFPERFFDDMDADRHYKIPLSYLP